LLPMAAVVALNAAEMAPAATTMELGTVRAELLLKRVTVAPPVGAAAESVTVQVLEAFGPRLVRLQTRVEDVMPTATELRLTLVFAEVLL
jgi:hypothetical protein